MSARTAPLSIAIAPRTLLLIVAIVAGVGLIVALFPVLLVLVAAAILSGTLSPAVEKLERRGMKRGAAIGIVFGVMILGIAALVLLTVPALVEQVQTLAESEPQVRSRVVHFLSNWSFLAPLAHWVRTVRIASIASSSADAALDLSARAIEVLAYIASAIFLALYFLVDRDRLRGMLFSLVPRRFHLRAARVLIELETIVGGYVRGQLVTSALMMGFVFVLLLVTGVENPLPIAVLAGIADVLPYVGVVLSVAPAAAAAIPEGWGIVTIVIGVMLVYEEIESRFIIPRVYGNVLRLPSSIVLVALLAGGTLMGIVGALLALPVAAAIRMLVEELRVELPGMPPRDPTIAAAELAKEDAYLDRTKNLPVELAAAMAIDVSLERTTAPAVA